VSPRPLIVCLSAVSLLAAASGGAAAELTPVDIATIRAEPVSQHYYAKHRAMFRKQGIDAKITLLGDVTQTVPALLSGAAQFIATPAGTAAVLRSRGLPVKVVAAGAVYDPKRPTSALVVAKGKPITRARDLVGKTIALDIPNTIADLGVKEWLSKGGVDPGDVKFAYSPFPLILAPLAQGSVDAAYLPEPYLTMALEQGAKRLADAFSVVCTKQCLMLVWIARADVDANVAARFRNAIQAAAVWADQPKNDEASGRILGKYLDIEPAVLKKAARSRFATRLRPSSAQPWLDLYAKYGLIPASFKAGDLVK
jgi:NitT/TauT family transport system substrate-binding protein